MTKLKVTATYEYIQGHLRYGDAHLIVDKEEWEKMSKEEQLETLRDEGDIVDIDYEIDDMGPLMENTLKTEEVKDEQKS